MNRSLLSVLIFMLGALSTPAFGQQSPVTECQSLKFTVVHNGAQVSLDVSQLRKERAELYRVLRSSLIQRASFISDGMSAIRNARSVAPQALAQSKDEDLKRFVEFLGTDALPNALQEVLFSCGNLMDGIAGELSLNLSKADGERLALLLTDPAFEKLARSMLQVEHSGRPVELRATDAAASARFRATVVESCKQYGVSASTCEKFPR